MDTKGGRGAKGTWGTLKLHSLRRYSHYLLQYEAESHGVRVYGLLGWRLPKNSEVPGIQLLRLGVIEMQKLLHCDP